MAPCKIVLADDHLIFREGIRRCLEDLENVQIKGEVSDGLELMELPPPAPSPLFSEGGTEARPLSDLPPSPAFF